MLYLVTILTAVCQLTLVNTVAIGNIRPDLLLILVVFVAMKKGLMKAALAGILAGFIEDIFSTGAFINTLAFPVYGILVSLLKEKFYFIKEKLSVELLIVLRSVIVDSIVHIIYFSNWDYPPSILALAVFIAVPTVLYTSFASVLLNLCGLKYFL